MSATWTTQFLPDQHLLLFKTSGVFRPEHSARMVQEVAALNLDPERDVILADHRDAVIKFGTMDIYDLPASYQSGNLATRFRVAIVFKQIGPDERFYENVCLNSGFASIKVFTDYNQAFQWLTGKLPQDNSAP